MHIVWGEHNYKNNSQYDATAGSYYTLGSLLILQGLFTLLLYMYIHTHRPKYTHAQAQIHTCTNRNYTLCMQRCPEQWGSLVPCLRALHQLPGSKIAPLQLLVHSLFLGTWTDDPLVPKPCPHGSAPWQHHILFLFCFIGLFNTYCNITVLFCLY